MAGPATDETVARLMADPSMLVAEIARYTELKAETESKMRAVVDEASANELLGNATKTLAAAEKRLEDADKGADEIIRNANARADEIAQSVDEYAASVRAGADQYAAEKSAAADRILMEATSKLSAVNQRETDAQAAISEARAAKAAAERSAREHGEALDAVHATQDRLEAVRRSITDALK